MSDLIIFVVGVFIFGVTVYGAVVGGGLAMHIQHMRENPEMERRAKARRSPDPEPAEGVAVCDEA